jgi:hypothetical protein
VNLKLSLSPEKLMCSLLIRSFITLHTDCIKDPGVFLSLNYTSTSMLIIYFLML